MCNSTVIGNTGQTIDAAGLLQGTEVPGIPDGLGDFTLDLGIAGNNRILDNAFHDVSVTDDTQIDARCNWCGER